MVPISRSTPSVSAYSRQSTQSEGDHSGAGDEFGAGGRIAPKSRTLRRVETRGPWVKHNDSTLLERRFFTVRSDSVTFPGGATGTYDWIAASDLVRVAAVTDDGMIYIVDQHHYLAGQMWQLPGGGVEPTEQPQQAAQRELAEEVGATADIWRHLGSVWPMPGLTPTRVHLYLAQNLTLGQASPEQSEADLVARPVPISEAVSAARDGTVGCAASAQLILAATR